MDLATFKELNKRVVEAGYQNEIDWQQRVSECQDFSQFAFECVWVIISSGMKNQVARKIEERVKQAWIDGQPIISVFKHKGKVAAIEYALNNQEELYKDYQFVKTTGNTNDLLAWLQNIPYIGTITKYHLAKNLGVDVVKPDRHLVRIAKLYDTTPDELCGDLARQLECKKATVDIIIWRAANLGYI